MNGTVRDYLESAENTGITRYRALIELKSHDIEDTNEFLPTWAISIYIGHRMF